MTQVTQKKKHKHKKHKKDGAKDGMLAESQGKATRYDLYDILIVVIAKSFNRAT